MYDFNGVTLDKMAEHTQSEDVQMRFEAHEVLTVDGHDMDAVTKAYRYAKESDNKPTLNVQDHHRQGHRRDRGHPRCSRRGGRRVPGLGPRGARPPRRQEVVRLGRDQGLLQGVYAEAREGYDAQQPTFTAWKSANPEKAQPQDAIEGKVPDLDLLIPAGAPAATRNAGATVIQPIAEAMPFYTSGSADLHGSNKNYLKGVGDFSKNNYGGRNFYYGIANAMGAILNGFGFYGFFRSSGSTFLVFSGYMMGSVRVAALSHLPIKYIWTHDRSASARTAPPPACRGGRLARHAQPRRLPPGRRRGGGAVRDGHGAHRAPRR